MNTKNITNKVMFQEFENLNPTDFFIKAFQNNFYSNEHFIEYFKEKGAWFWVDVIKVSRIELLTLFLKYKKYLIDFDVYYQIQIDEKKFLLDYNKGETSRILKRMLEYNDLYSKFSKKGFVY